jgi:hypothetical protein
LNLYEKLVRIYPELADKNDAKFWTNVIMLQDDSDGQGAYIAKWEYSKPIPESLSLGKPNA